METPGTILKREREARGITLREIAAITRIPVSALQHVEEDRYDLFPAEVFAKGFLRNYARELQVSVDDIFMAYKSLKQQVQRQQILEPTQVAITEGNNSEGINPLVLTSPDADHEPQHAGDSQRTFRFAYLIVILVVLTSVGLSVMFTGTGEAEENDRRRRDFTEQESEDSRWMMKDQSLTSQPLRSSETLGDEIVTE